MISADASEQLFVVDAHSLIFQVFYAIRGMTSPTGRPTNAVFGFVRDVLFLRGQNPTYFVCAFDRDGPTFRDEIYSEYKAHREPFPQDLLLQLPMIENALEAMNVPVLGIPGFEADDILATLARAGEQKGLRVRLCTSDKDCRQLLSDHVSLYNLRKHEEFGPAELLDDWGIRPDQVVDLQALVGDSVDNIPGVPGVGLKTAAKLLQEFGTLDNLLANLDKVTGKKQEWLRNSRDIVAISRKLVRLADNVPIRLDWDSWKIRPMQVDRVLSLFQEWGFQGLSNQIRTLAKGENSGFTQGQLFDSPVLSAGSPPAGDDSTSSPVDVVEAAEPWEAEYTLIDTLPAFQNLLGELRSQSRFAIDLETTSLSPHDAEIVGIALCWKAGRAYYLALLGPDGSKRLEGRSVLEQLRPILEDRSIQKVNQNIKYDQLVLRAQGIELQGVTGDSMVADYLLHAGERSHGLEDLSKRYLHHQVITIDQLIGKKGRNQSQLRMDQVPTEQVSNYAAEDADVAWRLSELLEKELEQAVTLKKLYDDLEIPLIDVLAEMEFNGIRLDVPYLKRVSEDMGAQLSALEAEIHTLAGHAFHIGSLPQLRKVLFDELKLPIQGRTGITGAPSTDQETLEKLAALDHPGAALPRKLLEHRQISKLKGTYVDALPTMVNSKTGRIHASFNQTVAATGRLSSSDPNLQNIPVRREMGQQIRKAFVTDPGWQLLTADYSQIELRLLAHFCEDEALCRAFAEGRDIHAAVAAQIFHVPEKEVTEDQRRMAKTVNFGVIYGISAAGLAQRLEIRREEGASFIKSYFERYPRVEAYQTQLLDQCRATGFATTILGRRRQFDRTAIRPNTSCQNRNQPEREAINTQV
ncbi:MAG: DNA polymerase I, partial [Gemmataceae bacterium]